MKRKAKNTNDYMVELVIKETTLTQKGEGVVLISGYANRYLDDAGNLIVDRSTESVLPQGYNLSNFLKNPVLLLDHSVSKPIGKIINIEPRVDGLYIEAEVHKFMDEKTYYGVVNKIIRAFSIGFKALDYTEVEGIYFWTAVELVEVSIVSVPDNQESLFGILTESPCSSGVCLLGTKALDKTKTFDSITTLAKKDWLDIDKKELKSSIKTLNDADVTREAYLVVKDTSEPDTWKFPHHSLGDNGLSINVGGVKSALSALKSVVDTSTDREELLKAAEHLKTHVVELVRMDLLPNSTLYEISSIIKTYSEDEPTEDESTEDESGQLNPQTTINSKDTTEQGQNTQDPQNSGEGNSKPDSLTFEEVLEFVGAAKGSQDGVEQLFLLYAQVADTLNEVLENQ